jgi:hypothetical protein
MLGLYGGMSVGCHQGKVCFIEGIIGNTVAPLLKPDLFD